MKNFTLKVQEIRKETKDTITLCFKQPGLRKIKYQAGQYLTLSLRINGRKYTRPYSFSSSPLVDLLLETTIKRIPDGIFSNHVHDTIHVGDMVEVMKPMGDFVHVNNESINQIYFWGVGSGITPLMSILKEVLISNPLVNVNLIYGNKNFESTIFLEEINQLVSKYPNHLKVWHFLTQYIHVKNHHFVKSGRIKKDFILDLLKDVVIEKTAHYVCGPVNLKNTIKGALALLECPKENIFSEDFELVKDPRDFDDITTHEVKINFQGKETLVIVEKRKSVLEAALDLGIELPYSCQTGSCSTCKGKLKGGKIRMIGLPKERKDLEQDDYLLCCSHPLTGDVYLEI
ncbi:flavin reductase family protein [Flavobacterium sp. DSR3-2]|uniref:flavin reductase family protein n=1 Tax=Flavobacterium sp. DSR3-2 TaxID=2804634 RepID=UPI003CF1E07B